MNHPRPRPQCLRCDRPVERVGYETLADGGELVTVWCHGEERSTVVLAAGSTPPATVVDAPLDGTGDDVTLWEASFLYSPPFRVSVGGRLVPSAQRPRTLDQMATMKAEYEEQRGWYPIRNGDPHARRAPEPIERDDQAEVDRFLAVRSQEVPGRELEVVIMFYRDKASLTTIAKLTGLIDVKGVLKSFRRRMRSWLAARESAARAR